ncbi:MAG: hypothetical protein ACREOF_03785 [Gemmatimonadales bacterium]
MVDSPLAFTPIERVALETIAEERPEVLDIVRGRLDLVLDDLSESCQGLVTNEADADDLLMRLRNEFVDRMMTEVESWGEDEDLREPAIDLVIRHLLAQAREGFVRRVVAAKRN